MTEHYTAFEAVLGGAYWTHERISYPGRNLHGRLQATTAEVGTLEVLYTVAARDIDTHREAQTIAKAVGSIRMALGLPHDGPAPDWKVVP